MSNLLFCSRGLGQHDSHWIRGVCVHLAGLRLCVVSQVVNGQGVAVWTSQQAERLKPLFNSKACLWVFGFQEGKYQEIQAWKEATDCGMC